MKYSKTTQWLISILIVFTVSIISGYYYWHAKKQIKISAAKGVSEKSKHSNDDPVAKVKTARLIQGDIKEILSAYGTVIPQSDKVKNFSVPFECLISGVSVTQGELVQKGQLLLKIMPSPDTQLHLEQAQSELDTAKKEEELTKNRLKLKLATQQDILLAKQKLYLAEKNIQNMKQRGICDLRAINAVSPGILYKINVQQGQIVPAGINLLQIVGQDQIIVRFGVESEDIEHLHKGQQVFLKPLHNSASKPVVGQIQTITHQVDPVTRLVNILAVPQNKDGLLLNDIINVDVPVVDHKALIVPRSAILPSSEGNILFTVENNRAVKHCITIGIETANEVEVISQSVHEGDKVVISGNYELSDGMLVTEGKR